MICRAGLVDQLIGMQMTEYLDREREYVVWTTAVNSISYVSTMLDRSPGYGHLEVRRLYFVCLRPRQSFFGYLFQGSE